MTSSWVLSQCQTSVWSWSLHCKIRVTSIIGDWQLVSWARDQGQAGRGNDRGQFISGVRIFVFTGREHDVTSPYHAAASSPDWSGWKLSIEVHMIPWYPMSLPASVIPCVLCTILMDIIPNKEDCSEQPDKNCMSKFWIEPVVVSAGGTVSHDQPWLVTRDILSWQTMSFRGLADKRWHNISLILQHINANVINLDSQRKLFCL